MCFFRFAKTIHQWRGPLPAEIYQIARFFGANKFLVTYLPLPLLS